MRFGCLAVVSLMLRYGFDRSDMPLAAPAE
jgi:hypothetical protein